jgi:hypothetical protein
MEKDAEAKQLLIERNEAEEHAKTLKKLTESQQ